MIMEVIDVPPIHVLEQGTRTKIFFGKNEFFYWKKNEFILIKDSKGRSRYSSKKLLKIRRPASRSLGEILRTNDQDFIDFIRQCLQFVYSISKIINKIKSI